MTLALFNSTQSLFSYEKIIFACKRKQKQNLTLLVKPFLEIYFNKKW